MSSSIGNLFLLATIVTTIHNGSTVVEAKLGGYKTLRHLDDFSITGNNGIPAAVFPLGECEGDCDNDGECANGLYCVQRTAGEMVPGCIGNLDFEADFCAPKTDILEAMPTKTMAPTESLTEATTTMAPTESLTEATTTTAPTESLTESTTTIEPTELLTQATTTIAPTEAETMAMTTVAPTELETMVMTTEDPSTLTPTEATSNSTTEGVSGTTAVLDDDMMGFLDTVGNNGNFPNYPLTLCQGDCDGDEDCAGELVCFQRAMDEVVPGCFGTGDFSIDYCTRSRGSAIGVISSAFEEPFPSAVVAGGGNELSDGLIDKEPTYSGPMGVPAGGTL